MVSLNTGDACLWRIGAVPVRAGGCTFSHDLLQGIALLLSDLTTARPVRVAPRVAKAGAGKDRPAKSTDHDAQTTALPANGGIYAEVMKQTHRLNQARDAYQKALTTSTPLRSLDAGDQAMRSFMTQLEQVFNAQLGQPALQMLRLEWAWGPICKV